MALLAAEAEDDIGLPEDAKRGERPSDMDAAPTVTEDNSANEPGTPVSVAPKPPSRRAQAANELKEQIAQLAGNVSKLSEGIGSRDQQLAELRGMMTGMASRPAQVQYAPAPPPRVDPQELVRKAQKALNTGDHDEYQRLNLEAATIMAEQRMMPYLQDMAGRVQQAQQAAQNSGGGVPPEIAAYMASYPDVARHPNHVELLMSKNQELNALQVPPGRERLARVFAEVNQLVKGGSTGSAAPGYSRGTASALSNSGGSRSTGGGGAGEPRMDFVPTKAEEAWATKLERQGIMNKDEYYRSLAVQNPQRVQR